MKIIDGVTNSKIRKRSNTRTQIFLLQNNSL